MPGIYPPRTARTATRFAVSGATSACAWPARLGGLAPLALVARLGLCFGLGSLGLAHVGCDHPGDDAEEDAQPGDDAAHVEAEHLVDRCRSAVAEGDGAGRDGHDQRELVAV